MKNRPGLKQYIFAALGVVILVLLDQYTKLLAIAHLKDQSAFVLWNNVFELHYLENRGAAFGIFQNQRWFFVHHDRCDPCYCELVLWQNSGRKKISATQNLYDHSDSRSNREFY